MRTADTILNIILAACRRELFDRRLRRIVHLAHEQKIPHSIGSSGRQLVASGEASSTLDFSLIQDDQSQDQA